MMGCVAKIVLAAFAAIFSIFLFIQDRWYDRYDRQQQKKKDGRS